MASNQKITRSEHVASLTLPPGRLVQVLSSLRRGDVLLRIATCLVAALCMWLITGAWAPPFNYRAGHTPRRDIVANVAFSVPDSERTMQLRKQKRSEVHCIYKHDPRPLEELRSALKGHIFQLLRAKSVEELDRPIRIEFLAASGAADSGGTASVGRNGATTDRTDADPQETDRTGSGATGQPTKEAEFTFEQLHSVLADDADLTRFARAIEQSFERFEETGLLEQLEHATEDGSQISIQVYPLSHVDQIRIVDVGSVRIAEVVSGLEDRLVTAFRDAEFPAEEVGGLARFVTRWLASRGYPTTLRLDAAATQREYDRLLPNVVAHRAYAPGDTLVHGGQPLTLEKLGLLRQEHAAKVSQMSVTRMIAYSAADLGMYVALFSICGVYLFSRRRSLWTDYRRLVTLLAAVVVTVALGRLCTGELWQAEVVPILLFGMTIAIAYSRGLAMLFSACVGLVLCLSLGLGLAEFVLMITTVSSAVLLLNRIRSRTKLIYVGLAAGVVAMATTLGVGTLISEPLGSWGGAGPMSPNLAARPDAIVSVHLLSGAVWNGFCALLSALIMTGLLPFVERIFDVQTDLSLLELGDTAHPLLRELARRTPSTYNHSINVASLAEAAAEVVGANALLVRVGAYFHDIGKMFKPGYFVENQDRDTNRHESLLPAMSTLVIIAHVKDGSDLARRNRLPQAIIDFIEQHHGTTLVEYFYRQAAKQSEDNPDKEGVEESSYRYPGPKPQTREAGILMLADIAESASRTLVDPTPSRIESLIHDLAMKRLLDGQFEECGMTLQELSRITDSLVKSLSAVYHSRVKYPDQQTA